MPNEAKLNGTANGAKGANASFATPLSAGKAAAKRVVGSIDFASRA